MPQFVGAGEAEPLARMLELSSVFVGYGLFAAAFVALGARLAFEER